MILTKMKKAGAILLSSVLICSAVLQFNETVAYAADSSFEAQLTAQGFPESYKVELRKLHEAHPNWTFKAKLLDYTWDEAVAKQIANQNANTISRNFPDAYKAVKQGTYDFENHDYIAKDGDTWVSASDAAVKFYMDPRNWLDEESIFMFEANTYNPSYQSEAIVKKILETTALPSGASKYYMEAAQQTYNNVEYSISPIYLATKTRIELGSSSFNIDGHEFTYGGKTYKGYYNTYNIGASDSPDGSAATKGLVFAAGGSDGKGTTYLRPWNSLEKAVKGGAIYIADNFIGNNQYSLYYERWNVLNGLSSVGTYQYATNVFNAATMAIIMQADYKDFGVLNEAFEFEIPVFQDMPETKSKQPPTSGNNNAYLDSITVTAGGKTLSFTKSFDRFTSTHTVSTTVGKSVDKVTVSAKTNASDATVTISGTELKEGQNKISVKVKSSSGLASRTYYVVVNKDSSIVEEPSGNENLISGVENTTIKASSEQGEGYIKVNWEKSAGYKVDYYEIFKSTAKDNFGSTAYFKTADGSAVSYKNTKELENGTRYYYKVRGVRVIDGKTYYTQWSNLCYRTYAGGSSEEPEEPSGNENLISGVENTTIKASSEQGEGYIKVNWEKSAGYKVDYYEIFKSTDKDDFGDTAYFKTADGSAVSYKNTKELENGTRYYYTVRGVRVIDGKTYYTQWSGLCYRTYAGTSVIPNAGIINGVENTTIKASSEQGEGYIKVNWEKSAGYKVDYYEIFKSTDKDDFGDTTYFKTADGSAVSYKNTKELENGTRYYYKVRGVRVIDGKTYYTQWSGLCYRTYAGKSVT